MHSGGSKDRIPGVPLEKTMSQVHTVDNNDVVKKLILELVHMEDLSAALSLVLQRSQALLGSNVVEVAELLKEDSERLGQNDTAAVIDEATAFIIECLEEMVGFASSMSSRNQAILKSIVEASKESPHRLDQVVRESSPQMDSTFLTYVSSEITRLEGHGPESETLLKLMSAVRERVVSELTDMTKMDADFAAGLLRLEDQDERQVVLEEFFNTAPPQRHARVLVLLEQLQTKSTEDSSIRHALANAIDLYLRLLPVPEDADAVDEEP